MTERSTPATYQRSPHRGREDDGRDPRRAHAANPRMPCDDNDDRRRNTWATIRDVRVTRACNCVTRDATMTERATPATY